jgi:hypothetical protein
MFNQEQASALASLVRQINERRDDDALTPVYLNFYHAEALWSAIDAMQKELGHRSNVCGCVLGTCQSKAVGCRMREEVKPGSGAQ